jgi:hypothetical protein
MTDTAKRLAGPTQITSGEVTFFTNGGSTVAIIRHIHICNTTANGATVKMSIGADSAATRIMSDVRIEAYSTYDWSGFLVLGNSESLRAQSGTNNALTAVVSGVEVT